jgi:hypothetical protein
MKLPNLDENTLIITEKEGNGLHGVLVNRLPVGINVKVANPALWSKKGTLAAILDLTSSAPTGRNLCYNRKSTISDF